MFPRLSELQEPGAQLPGHLGVDPHPREIEGDAADGGVGLGAVDQVQEGGEGVGAVEEDEAPVVGRAPQVEVEVAAPGLQAADEEIGLARAQPESVGGEAALAPLVEAGPGLKTEGAQAQIEAQANAAAVQVAAADDHALQQLQGGAGAPEGLGLLPLLIRQGAVGEEGQAPAAQGAQGQIESDLALGEARGGGERGPCGEGFGGAHESAADEVVPASEVTRVAGRPPVGETQAGAAVAGGQGEPVVGQVLPGEVAVDQAESQVGKTAEQAPLARVGTGGPGQAGFVLLEVGQQGGVDVSLQPGPHAPRWGQEKIAVRRVGREGLSPQCRGGEKGEKQERKEPKRPHFPP